MAKGNAPILGAGSESERNTLEGHVTLLKKTCVRPNKFEPQWIKFSWISILNLTALPPYR